MKKNNFFVKDFIFNQKGLKDFYCPISMKILEKFKLQIYQELLFLIKSDKNKFYEMLKLNIFLIAKDLTNFFAIKKYILLSNKKPYSNFLRTKYTESIYLKKKILFTKDTNLFFNGLQKKNKILSSISKAKSYFFSKNLKYIKKENIKDNHIITFTKCELIERKLSQEKHNVRLSSFYDWFKYGKINEKNLQMDEIEKNSSLKTFNTINKVFKNFGINLLENEKNYIVRLIDSSFKVSLIHYSSLLNNRRYLPKKVWLGSTGISFNRIFSYAVMMNGGIVYGFDHGAGSGWKDSITQHVIEFNYLDHFFTYNKKMQSALKKKFNKNLLFNKFRKNNIHYVEYKEKKNTKYIKKGNVYKSIVYIPRIYTKEAVIQGFNLFYPHQVYLDWQARLFNNLKNLGFDLYYKPHPANYHDVPISLLKKFDLKIIEKNMLNAYKKADILLFDSVETSAFNESLKTNIPILLININERNLDQNFISILKKRCGYISTNIDKKNRLILNSDLINLGIKEVKKKKLLNQEIFSL